MATHTSQERSPSLHEVVCRVIPPVFAVHNDGTFSVDIIVPDDEEGRPAYPSVQLDLPDYAGATISIVPGRSAYGAPAIPVEYEKDSKVIHLLSPVVLISKGLQPEYKAQNSQPPQPSSAPAAQ